MTSEDETMLELLREAESLIKEAEDRLRQLREKIHRGPTRHNRTEDSDKPSRECG